jgi:hypothetical protein
VSMVDTLCCSLQHSVSFSGKFSLNFDLKNMISTYTKEKMTQICQILKIFFSNCQIFNDQFLQVAKNIEEFGFFPTFISSMQPNLAKLFCEWLPLWLHHKILKRNPAPATLQETHPKPNSGRLDVGKLISYSRLTPVHCVHWPDIICIIVITPLMYIMMNVGGSVVQIMNERITYLGSHVKLIWRAGRFRPSCTTYSSKMWHMTQNGLKCSHMEQ